MRPSLPPADQLPPEWGLTPEGVFSDPRVVAWRTLPERDNAVLEVAGHKVHVKRHRPVWAGKGESPARAEVRAWQLLRDRGIPTLELIAWGELPDGRSYTLSADLAGYVSGQVSLRRVAPSARAAAFEALLDHTASLAARLHTARLHHRDLYLCHFFIPESPGEPTRLIDVARVRPLPIWPLDRRWIIKDLAQFVYSLREFELPDSLAQRWLGRYVDHGGPAGGRGLWGSVRRKADSIRRHDERLRLRQPGRDVSIPERGGPA